MEELKCICGNDKDFIKLEEDEKKTVWKCPVCGNEITIFKKQGG